MPKRRIIGEFVGLTAAYLILAVAGLQAATFFEGVSPIWPASGLAVVVLRHRGLHLLPAIGLAVSILGVVQGLPTIAIVGGALAQMGEGAVAVLLLRWVGARSELAAPRDVVGLLGAAIVAALVSGAVGIGAFSEAGVLDSQAAGRAFGTWVAGDALGIIAVVPITVVPGRWKRVALSDRSRLLKEVAVWMAVIFAIPLLAFAFTVPPMRPMLLSTMVPVVLVGSFRVGLMGTISLNLAATWAALLAPAVVGDSIGTSFSSSMVLSLSGFLSVLMGSGLLAAASLQATRDAQKRQAAMAARWKTVFDVSDNGIAVLGPEGQLLDVNQAYAESLGYEREEMIGQSVKMVWFEGTEDERRRALAQMKEGGRTHVRTFDRHRAGHPVEVEVSASLLESGGEVASVGVIRNLDIADAASNAHLGRALGRSLAPRVLGSDPDDPSTLVEPLAELSRLLVAQEVVLAVRDADQDRQLVTSTQTPLTDEALLDLLEEAWVSGSAVAYRQSPDGDRSYFTAVSAGEGSRFVLGVSADKIMSRGLLDALLDEIGLALTQRRDAWELRRRAEVAARLETAGTVAAGLTHDFNNLLAAIITNLVVIGEAGTMDEEARAAAVDAEAAARRAAALTDQLLLLTSKQTLERVPTDLQVAAKASLRIARSLLPRGVRLTWISSLDEDQPAMVLGDGVEIERVLLNLLLNARDAMNGEGELTIELGRQEGRFYVQVSDTGLGIPKELQPRIFEPFFTTKELGHGTGLGLAMVHGIVSAHDGEVVLESAVGEGARFRLLFPILQTDRASAQLPSGSTAIPASDEEQRRILIVDDELSVARALRRFFAHRGFEVHLAADGQQALEAMGELDQVDLVLTDVRMPRMDGWTLAERLASSHPDLPVAIMAGQGPRDEAPPANVKSVAIKPLSRREMGELIELTRA